MRFSTQEDQLREFYENEGVEELRLTEGSPHYIEFLTAARYLDMLLPPNSRVLDSCAGTGVYSFYLARRGHAVAAGDIVERNVAWMREEQRQEPLLEEIYLGDALELSRFADSSFDAVLCMGALYHMPDPAGRRRAVEECLRVLRPGGLLVCSYMNRYGVILADAAGDLDNLNEILRFAKEGTEGIFYAATPEEIETLMAECGVEKVCHAALDGLTNFLRNTAGLLSESGAMKWREVHFALCETPSLLGTSYHNLFIGRRKASAPAQ